MSGTISRALGAAGAVVLAAVAMTGCALQADWDGSRRLASEECRLAAQLFAVAPEVPVAGAADGLGSARAALADQLRPHLPEDLHALLDYYAYPLPPQGLSEELDVAFVRVQTVRDWADVHLREWAQLRCGVEVAGEPAELPDLGQLLAFESEVDGVRLISVAGALDPDHAVILCEEVRLREPAVRIEVTDADAFPLALAEAGQGCGHHPILLVGLAELERDGDGGEIDAGASSDGDG